MNPVETAHRHGGWATRAKLGSSGKQLQRAIPAGDLIRVRRGCYAVPQLGEACLAALALSGVLVTRSAAAHWGWALKTAPQRPEIAVARNRSLSTQQRRSIAIQWRDLSPSDIVNNVVTSEIRSALDCASRLPWDEALAAVDSALRSGRIRRSQLLDRLSDLPRTGRSRAARVIDTADPGAANPFESVLRALALDAGATVRAQVSIRCAGHTFRVDLADITGRIVLEADSFEYHGHRAALTSDAHRYDELTLHGWRVLRFSWEQVMHEPDWVKDVIRRATSQLNVLRPSAPQSASVPLLAVSDGWRGSRPRRGSRRPQRQPRRSAGFVSGGSSENDLRKCRNCSRVFLPVQTYPPYSLRIRGT